MASHVPIIAQRYALTGDYGPIPTCVTQDRRRYIARQPLITQVARKCGRNPDSLWAVYLRADGGESFREVLRQDLGAQGVVDVDPLIQFEADGIVWLLQRLAVHFVAQYDPTLEYTIYKHFDETALTPPGSASPNASPVASRSRPAGPLDVLMGMLQEMMGHRDTLDRHENLHAQYGQKFATIDQKVEDLDTRTRQFPQRQTLRDFVLHVLKRREPTRQLQDWGRDLSRDVRAKRLHEALEDYNVFDPLSGLFVHSYQEEDLREFFRLRGLL